jgi:hypothetical protein
VDRGEEKFVTVSGDGRVWLEDKQLVRTQVALVIALSRPREDWVKIFGLFGRHKKGAHGGNLVSPMLGSILSG